MNHARFSSPGVSKAAVRCREIVDADLESVIDLLTFGFSNERNRDFWQQSLDRLGHHAPPPGYPRFGYVLDNAGTLVGVVLQIFSQAMAGALIQCSMSSWWVLPEFRVYAPMLVARALRHNATYTNITPAPHTWKILEAQGYKRYCNGWVMALSWLARNPERARVTAFDPSMAPDEHLTAGDIAMLRDHASYGCICLVCEAGGRRYPFVFAPRRNYGIVGFTLPVYCSEGGDASRFAGPLGRHLARRGYVMMYLDAEGPLPGITGVYRSRRPKFYKGAVSPRVGDYAYSERAMFGA